MSKDSSKIGIVPGDVKQQGQDFHLRLHAFLAPLLEELDALLDRRLVSTFSSLLACILRFRHRNHGLLLSELGAVLLGPAQAPAGTKRISNLLRSQRWSHTLLDAFLLRKAQEVARHLGQTRQQGILLWDESVIEKPESLHSEGLCAVKSSKARRLKRIKPGFYNPPGGHPVHVPGFEWMGLLLAGLKTYPTVAFFRWYTRRGEHAQDRGQLRLALLEEAVETFGQKCWHIFDRGYASKAWLGQLLERQVGFVLRWPKAYQLVDAQGARSAWKIARGRSARMRRLIWDAHQHCHRYSSALALPVTHPAYPEQTCLVSDFPSGQRQRALVLAHQSTLSHQKTALVGGVGLRPPLAD